MSDYHLAQLNIARMKTHLEHPSMEGFVSRLDEINSLAEKSTGFVWRLKDEETGNAMEIQAFDDPKLVVNLSVWQSIESLRAFTYNTAHTDVMRQRKQWFEHLDIYMVLWWIPKGHIPSLEEAKERLSLLEKNGSRQAAFTFRTPFDSPSM